MTLGDHWYPQNNYLVELIDYVQNALNQTTEDLESYLMEELVKREQPYILIDYIMNEAMLRRKNTKLYK